MLTIFSERWTTDLVKFLLGARIGCLFLFKVDLTFVMLIGGISSSVSLSDELINCCCLALSVLILLDTMGGYD